MKNVVRGTASTKGLVDVNTEDGLGVVRIEHEHGEPHGVVVQANRAVWSKGDLKGLVGELKRIARGLRSP